MSYIPNNVDINSCRERPDDFWISKNTIRGIIIIINIRESLMKYVRIVLEYISVFVKGFGISKKFII